MGRPKKNVSEENIQRFQRELELAGNRTEVLLQDKKGRSRSCLLCRRRKQRCDHKQPSCTTCLKANVKCIQPARYNASFAKKDIANTSVIVANNNDDSSPSSYSESTVEQDHYLTSKQYASAAATTTTATNNLLPSINETTPQLFKPRLKSSYSHSSVQSIEQQPQNTDTAGQSQQQYTLFLENKIRLLEKILDSSGDKLHPEDKKVFHLLNSDNEIANTLPLPPPPPTSHSQPKILPLQSSFTTANGNCNNNPNQTNNRNVDIHGTIPALTSDCLDSIDFSTCIFAKYNLKEFIKYDPVFEFDENLSRSFLDTFFTRLQFKYPLLDEQEIYSFHEDYIKNNIHSYSESGFHFACGRMWLLFSISACLHMTTGKYKGLPPVRYFSTAIRHITRCGKNLNHVQQVELLTLLVLYILRTDRDSSVLYEIIKDVMSICKDKLHLNNWQPEDQFVNKKLRLFWCVYLLERMICVAVGRPYTITESEIKLPLFNEASFNTRSTNDRNTQHRGVHFINQSLKLRRIESQFVETLQILPQRLNNKEVLRKQLPTVKNFFQDLEIWRSSCSRDDVKNFENETLKLYYYRSVRLLIQPYLEFLTPEDRLFRECQAAAGQICQLYKIFHQKTVTGHSTPAVHTVFVAGVTLIYCMWLARNNDDQRRKKLGDESKHTRPLISASLFSTMDDLRACSVCLYVMTERSNFARTFRDTFDQLMNATVGNLIERCGPDSSELIYLSSSSKWDVDTEEESETDSSHSQNKMKINNGMPPAVKRTFGKRQAEEHVGFVEISQVDPEEQKEYKRKQGVLEKTSVPKSLSHLLIKVEENPKEMPSVLAHFKPETSISRSQTDVNTLSMTQDKNSIHQASKIDKNQYIVKKPTNSTEFDWKVFQQQAFLQQQAARQNLRAYLSSLHYNGKQGGTPDALKIPINVQSNDSPQKFSDFTTSQANNYTQARTEGFSPIVSQVSSSLSPPMNPIQMSNVENVNINDSPNTANNTSTNTGTMPIMVTMVPNQHVASANPNSLLNGGILFNNGAHDMINDISTWTNDSVAELMNTNVILQEATPQEGITHFNQQQQYQLQASQGSQPHQGIPSRNHGQLNTTFGPPNGNVNGNMPPVHEQLEEGTVQDRIFTSTGEIAVHESNSNELQRKRQIQLPSATARDSMVEEFWTVNDDYGFLA